MSGRVRSELRPEWPVRVSGPTRFRDAHECEPWQIRDSARGGQYCAACGETVVPPSLMNRWKEIAS